MVKSLFLLFLVATSSLSAYVPGLSERPIRNQAERVNVYNENYYPPNYGYGAYGYYGYPAVQTPAEAFPDDAEAEYLFDKMHE